MMVNMTMLVSKNSNQNDKNKTMNGAVCVGLERRP